MRQTTTLTAPRAVAVLFLVAWPLACMDTRPDDGAALDDEAAHADNARLYDRHCALCHGYDGLADGPAALLLFPPARDFSTGRFRLVSTDNGAPTDEDLVRTLRRGMPGSAMPAFSWMTDDELMGLARYVRWLAVEGAAERIVRVARAGGGTVEPASAREVAERRFEPGAVLSVGAPAAKDEATLAVGRQVFVARCAVCHGEDGMGRAERPTWNEDGHLNWARDFTAGIMNGSASHEALAWRIQTGLPGTAMPGTRFDDPAELAAVVAYVQELIPYGADDRLVLGRETLRARRVPAGVPLDPEDERWEQARPIEVELAPLWWRPDSVRHASVRALHDGAEVALLVRWHDATRDDAQHGSYPFGDAVAVQLSSDPRPSLFGMGAPGHVVDQWHWRALKLGEIGGWLDLLGDAAHRARDLGPEGERADVPRYVPAEQTEGAVEERRAVGIDAVNALPQADTVHAQARWRADGWEVVFTRALEPEGRQAVGLAPSTEVQLALAIWNGAAGDLRGQKSISIWQGLVIEP